MRFSRPPAARRSGHPAAGAAERSDRDRHLPLLVVAVTVVLGRLDATGFAWLDDILTIAGSAAALVLAWLLFPVVVAATLGWFADDVARAVERRYYPDLPAPVGMGIGESVLATLRFTAVALTLNLLALPLYLLPGRISCFTWP